MPLIEIRLSGCIERFIEHCQKTKSWNIYKDQNLFHTETGYHKLILVQDPQLGSFKDAIKYPNSFIHDGTSYRNVRNDFTALVSMEPVSAAGLLLFEENKSLSSRLALYDLGSAVKHPSIFSKINLTKSEVFIEFEKFLAEIYQITLPAFTVSLNQENNLQIIESNYLKTEAAITSMGTWPNRLSKIIRTPPFLTQRRQNISSRQIGQDSFFEKHNSSNCIESGCCLCIATTSAHLRPLLT